MFHNAQKSVERQAVDDSTYMYCQVVIQDSGGYHRLNLIDVLRSLGLQFLRDLTCFSYFFAQLRADQLAKQEAGFV